MKKILLILLALTITTINLKAEKLQGQAKIDSLLSELPKAKGDTNEVKLLNNLSYTLLYREKDKGVDYAQKGLKLSERINWQEGKALSYNNLAISSHAQSQYSRAIEYWNKALKIYNKIGNKSRAASILGNIGNYYNSLSDYAKALEYYIKSLKFFEDSGYEYGIATMLGNIGNIYIYQSDYEKTLEYYFKALKIYEEIGDNFGIARILGNIGIVYNDQSNYNKALEFYQKALKKNKELGAKEQIAIVLGNIATIYDAQSNYLEALEYYNKSIKIQEEIGDKDGIAINLGNMGSLYFALSQDSVKINSDELDKYISLDKIVNINKSIEFLLKSIKIGEETGEINNRSEFLKTLALAYKQKGDMRNAYEALEEHHKFKDSVFSQENADKIAALEKAREDDLKQKEIEKQKIRIAEQEKREQLILYFSIGFFIVMAVVMIVIYRLLKRSDKLLYNVLPVSIAKRLKKKEHPISDYFTQASIVFIDIVNFTELAKDEDPRRVVEALNKIFTKYDTIANKYGLEKIKTIGDSYMAAAGIPEVQKDNTHRAAQMALEVKELMEDYHTADGTKIEVRIGLDCGPVVAGVIGENKFIYDMWSDAVNTASRMESSSESGQVHITERFKEAVSEYEEFEYVERGEIEIKGKGKMKTYYIENKEVVNV